MTSDTNVTPNKAGGSHYRLQGGWADACDIMLRTPINQDKTMSYVANDQMDSAPEIMVPHEGSIN